MTEVATAEVQVLDITRTEAPVAMQGPCTRKRLLDPPDWRYRAAVEFIRQLRRGQSPTIPSDPVVQYIARGLRVTTLQDSHMQKFLLQCWPELMETIYYGTLARRSAIACLLDTCHIKGWTYDEACIAGCPVNRTVYHLYGKAFFDLTGVRTVASWIQDNLIEPERHNNNTALLRARLLAFHGSGTAGAAVSSTGMLDASEKELMQSISKNERSKQLFDYMVRHVKIEPDVYVGMMESALKSMSDQEFQRRQHEQDMVGSSSLEDLANNLEIGVRAFTNQEIQGYDQYGLDFVNQFTKILSKEDDNGKADITDD